MDNVLCRSCRVRRSIKQVARARGNSMKRTPDRCLFPVDRTTRGNSKNEERQRADALVTIMKTTGSRGINCESRPRGRKKEWIRCENCRWWWWLRWRWWWSQWLGNWRWGTLYDRVFHLSAFSIFVERSRAEISRWIYPLNGDLFRQHVVFSTFIFCQTLNVDPWNEKNYALKPILIKQNKIGRWIGFKENPGDELDYSCYSL